MLSAVGNKPWHYCCWIDPEPKVNLFKLQVVSSVFSTVWESEVNFSLYVFMYTWLYYQLFLKVFTIVYNCTVVSLFYCIFTDGSTRSPCPPKLWKCLNCEPLIIAYRWKWMEPGEPEIAPLTSQFYNLSMCLSPWPLNKPQTIVLSTKSTIWSLRVSNPLVVSHKSSSFAT